MVEQANEDWVLVQARQRNVKIASEHVSVQGPLLKGSVPTRPGDPTPASVRAGVTKLFEKQEKLLRQQQVQ